MTRTIYWGYSVDDPYRRCAHDLVPAVETFDPIIRESNYLRCPSALAQLRNTYALLSPVETSVKWEWNSKTSYDLTTPGRDQEWYDSRILHYDFSNKLVQITTGYTFFSETPIMMRQTGVWGSQSRPDSVSRSSFFLGGQFDISKWFRRMNIAFCPYENSGTLEIKNKDPLCFIEFMCEEKVNFKKFEMSEELGTIEREYAQIKNSKKGVISLKSGYDKFLRDKSNRKVLREIKKNLID